MSTRIFDRLDRQEMLERAKYLRVNATKAEKILWEELRDRKLDGYKFRRQHPIEKFIVDFFCYKAKLIIELDDVIHENFDQKEYDDGRTSDLNDLGYKVIRFKNEDVTDKLALVLNKIKSSLV